MIRSKTLLRNALLFILGSTILWVGAVAGSASTSFEPEEGALAGTAVAATDSSASKGGYVAFQGTTGQPTDRIQMRILSQGIPSFASSGTPSSTTFWESTSIPAWLAYDLSSKPVALRQKILVSLTNNGTDYYYNPNGPNPLVRIPVNYTIESNSAPGGTQPPASGWTVIGTVTSNSLKVPQTFVNLNGANWVRINVTSSTTPNLVNFAADVYSAPNNGDDDWLFMGDSITYMSIYPRGTGSVASLVNQAVPARYPMIINAGIGGTTTATALAIIDTTLANFPGKYVTLNYGTNDYMPLWAMEDLVKKVIAAGKVPVIPYMPWSNPESNKGLEVNPLIEALYAKYPQILRGPDLYNSLKGRVDLFRAPDDVHPNEAGSAYIRQLWAEVLARVQ